MVRQIPGVVVAGSDGNALVQADAPPMMWLIGAVCDEDITIVNACAASDGSRVEADLAQLEAGLPGGLEVLGAYVLPSSTGQPCMPKEVPPQWRNRFRFLATRSTDSALVLFNYPAKTDVAPLGPWTVEPSQRWARDCVRGRLSISVAASCPQQAGRQLENIAGRLSTSLRFRFPGSDLAPTIKELGDMKPAVKLPTKASTDGLLVVEVLAEACDAPGPSNFASLDAELPHVYGLDFAAYITPGLEAEAQAVNAATALALAAGRQLAAAKRAALAGAALSFHCFAPPGLGHVLSLSSTEDAQERQALHRLLRLPQAPLLLPACAVPWGEEAHPCATGKPLNPHAGCAERPSWWKGRDETTKTVFVRGQYEYCHYMQDNVDDSGWGCAYRSVQTLVSWYRMQFYSSKDLPMIADIQMLLKRIDEANKDIVIGSKTWIGTVEGMLLLQDYLGVECRMLHCHDAADMARQVPQILKHFEQEGTPIMMGAGEYAYTLVGLCSDSASAEVGFMIVDPHYTGADTLKSILQKGWVGWKNLEFFEKTTNGGFINLCLPMVPKDSEIV